MKKTFFLSILIVTAGLFVRSSHFASRNQDTKPPAAVDKVPPLPPGVAELKFNEFFVSPVGPRGLELTDKLKSLDGQRVRMLGYMVRQEHTLPGKFLFTAMPVQIHDHDSELADDLPPATVCVAVPTTPDRAIPYASGLMLLTGTLSVSPREEADGRVSLVRLALDPPDASEARLLAGKKQPRN